MPLKDWKERVKDAVVQYETDQIEAGGLSEKLKAENVESQQRYDAHMPDAFERFAADLESAGFSVSKKPEHLALNSRLDRPPISFHAVAVFRPSKTAPSIVELSAGTNHNKLDELDLPAEYTADDVVAVLGDHLANSMSQR
ncbi:MAG: hypothetical protein IH945_02090 [Armatimonadetes bacterium]|nr:hypothetical protein [Armatimonadota bacterium]